jgi:hypothetical protein
MIVELLLVQLVQAVQVVLAVQAVLGESALQEELFVLMK